MLETVVAILIFVAVIGITALLFGGWLVVVIVSAISRVLMLPFRDRPATAMLAGDAGRPRCANERCRAENVAVAAFCRRCGTPMRAAQQAPVRRVAMW